MSFVQDTSSPSVLFVILVVIPGTSEHTYEWSKCDIKARCTNFRVVLCGVNSHMDDIYCDLLTCDKVLQSFLL